MMFGNVNVDYKPCKSVVQLQRAADYILGRQPEQIRDGVVKTAPNLYWGINCDRDNFARDVMMTRKLFGKRETRSSNLAFKMSISFHPDDNDKLAYDEAFRIAKEFAEKFFQGYEVLFAVHTDTEHIHVHFLIGNCHIETGKAYRRNQKDLYNMCEFFGEQCHKRGLVRSVHKDFYNHDIDTSPDKEKVGEHRMKANGKETFKDELREVIQIELADPNNHTLEEVVNALMKHYNVECRVKGNTISYLHPNFTDKSGKLASIRGSKLGDKYTVKGIEHELREKQREQSVNRTDTLAGADFYTKNNLSVFTRVSETTSTEETPAEESHIYITGNRGTNGNTTSGVGRDRNEGSGDGGGNRHDLGRCQEGRTGTASGDGNAKNVPTFEELFDSYKRRNAKVSRKGTPESEHTKTVRRKRKGIDR